MSINYYFGAVGRYGLLGIALAGRFFFHRIASLTEMEMKLTGERTRAGLEVARQLGRKGGFKRKMTDSKIESTKKIAGQRRAAARRGQEAGRVRAHSAPLDPCVLAPLQCFKFRILKRPLFHSFRPGFITSLLDGGAMPHLVASIVGHEAELITDKAYWNTNDAAKRKPTVDVFSLSAEILALLPAVEGVTFVAPPGQRVGR